MDPTSPLATLDQLLSAKPKALAPINFWHTDDYTEVRVGTLVYLQTRLQAAAIALIHQGHIDGRLDVPATESSSRSAATVPAWVSYSAMPQPGKP